MNSTIKWPSWFVLTRHWLSLVGVALVTTAVISWLFVLPLRIRGHVDNPYVGIVIFLILPALFFTGLVLIPIGIGHGRGFTGNSANPWAGGADIETSKEIASEAYAET